MSEPTANTVTAENVTPTNNKRWYVVHAYSGMEKAVERNLRERIDRAGMQDKFGRIMVPVEEVVELKGGQKSISERKFFPGYLLVEMEMNDETWHLVKNTGKVAKSPKLYSYQEFCFFEALNDMTNYQRTYSIGEVEVEGSAIYHKTEFRERRNHYTLFACTRPIAGFDTSRYAWLRASPLTGRLRMNICNIRSVTTNPPARLIAASTTATRLSPRIGVLSVCPATRIAPTRMMP